MLTAAGLREVTVNVGARRTGDPFTVLIASGIKPSATFHEATKSQRHTKK
jgi:hypothetical protein